MTPMIAISIFNTAPLSRKASVVVVVRNLAAFYR